MDIPVVVGVDMPLVCRIGNVNSASTRRGFVLTWMMACWEGGIVDLPNHQQHQKSCTRMWFRGSMHACMGLPEYYFILYQTIHHHAHEIILWSTFII